MTKSPAFQFYPKDFLSDEKVRAMELRERGAYITLLCYCWLEGTIPADINRMAKLCDCHAIAMTEIWQVLCDCFEPSPLNPSRLVNPRLEIERENQLRNREKRTKAGVVGANSRWHNNLVSDSKRMRLPCTDAIGLPLRFDGSSSASATASANTLPTNVGRGARKRAAFAKPSPADVTAYAIARGWNVSGDAFCDFYESKGWRVGNQPMKSWQAAVGTWARRDAGKKSRRTGELADFEIGEFL